MRLMRDQGRVLHQRDGWSLRVVRCLSEKGLVRVQFFSEGSRARIDHGKWEATATPSVRGAS